MKTPIKKSKPTKSRFAPMPTEDGAASIFIKLKDGNIEVLHGSDNSRLLKRKAPVGIWDEMWNVLRNYKSKK